MAQYYNSIKTMRTARIGTIMPWGGNGFEGFSADNVPKGWRICDGTQLDALEYPLLAAELGTTYGGSMTGEFPNYNVDDNFVIPNISNRAMIDLEPEYLALPKYQYGQGDVLNTVFDSDGTKVSDIIKDFGTTAVIKANYSANADIDFVLPTGTNLSGKFTGMDISDPDFTASITTLNRKLGINHNPGHNHPGTFASASAGFIGPMLFTSANIEISGSQPVSEPSCSSSVISTNYECQLLPSQSSAPSWQNGRTLIAFYGDNNYEHTLPVMDRFYDFVSDTGKDYWSEVPAPDWHDGTPTRNSPNAVAQTVNFAGSTYTSQFPYEPVKTHANKAWTGLFPKPLDFGNRNNFYGYDKGNYNNVANNPENPSTYFTVNGVNVPQGVTEFTLPAGTDIRTTKQSQANPSITWYEYNKIHPWQLVDGEQFAKGTYITEIEREGTDDSNYIYTIKISFATIASSNSATVIFREGTWPTSMSNFHSQDPDDSAFTSHNHGTFDIQMSRGSLNAPFTFPLNDISIGSVSPDNLDDALNIIIDTDQASMNIVYLIKAY